MFFMEVSYALICSKYRKKSNIINKSNKKSELFFLF